MAVKAPVEILLVVNPVLSLKRKVAPILSTDTESVFGHIFDQISWVDCHFAQILLVFATST